jgi:hypothetical protein
MSHIPNAAYDRRDHSMCGNGLGASGFSVLVACAHWNSRKQQRLPIAGKVIDWLGAFPAIKAVFVQSAGWDGRKARVPAAVV